MNLTEDIPVAPEALPIAALRAHLKLPAGFDDDGVPEALLEQYLRAAIAVIEGRTGKALIARGFRLNAPEGAPGGVLVLPLAPVTAAEGGGTLRPDAHRPRLEGLPPGPLAITLTAGFGPWEAVPPDLAQAVILLAAEYFEMRDEGALRVAGLPVRVAALLDRWRPVRLLRGAGRCA
ncbi:head-tail connector protein [Falsirhodobacter algicola]|uniref:PhiE125 gp8 family phage protein n=1 Tax=Falsirhodobacter algicola TaxID=2692330 RepID=A0A8J8MRQ4_9RHOB|nr:hypothetical protein [Falsirhodobacter algicola]QUS35151.1 hypothetical protein GR316_02000 [Falsirhodobacter algicola]